MLESIRIRWTVKVSTVLAYSIKSSGAEIGVRKFKYTKVSEIDREDGDQVGLCTVGVFELPDSAVGPRTSTPVLIGWNL
jgi:hypothetical protein